ncbi:MAG TPA: glutaredoxin family protein [Desulfobulbus sp.]|nr:glutaredoxin family protein [Desulfobulbus sp.]HHD63783.1 glutaredoxin family protein [Desulfobulbaceae bacterium]
MKNTRETTPTNTQPEIRLITLSTCYFCSLLKKRLDEKGFMYTCTDIDLLPDEERRNRMEEIRKFNPEETFPIVIIGNKAIVGFQEERIKKELGLL